jgi:hypothetical protein
LKVGANRHFLANTQPFGYWSYYSRAKAALSFFLSICSLLVLLQV